MNRRTFCKQMLALGGLTALGPFLQACGKESAALESKREVAPVDVPAGKMPRDPALATIALVKTDNRADGVRQVIELLGINPVQGRHVLLKPNFNSADEAPGSTHPQTLDTVLASLRDLRASSITMVDRSGMGNTRQVMERIGAFQLATTYAADCIDLEELPQDAWQLMDGDTLHWQAGFPLPKMLLDNECIVQTCNLKTHQYGGHFTMSLKNSVGLVARRLGAHDFMNELHGSMHQRKMIAEINLAYHPALIILDGVEAFAKGGPARGTKVTPQVILAGTDRIAIDAAGVAILRMFGTTPEVSRGTVFEQDQIARAVALGLGVSEPGHIRFLTRDAESLAFSERLQEELVRS